jgi:hypothetical protein
LVAPNRGERSANTSDRALLAIEVFAVAAGVFPIITGHILGERTTGVATVSWIFGIGLINAYGPIGKACGRVLE